MLKFLSGLFTVIALMTNAYADNVWRCEKMDYYSSGVMNKWKTQKETTLTDFVFSISKNTANLTRGENSEKVDIIYNDENRIDMLVKYKNSTEIFTLLINTNTLIYAKTGVDITGEKGFVAFGYSECEKVQE